MTRTVRVTIWPNRDLEVGDRDYLGLKQQGLILREVEPAPELSPLLAVDPGPAPAVVTPAADKSNVDEPAAVPAEDTAPKPQPRSRTTTG